MELMIRKMLEADAWKTIDQVARGVYVNDQARCALQAIVQLLPCSGAAKEAEYLLHYYLS